MSTRVGRAPRLHVLTSAPERERLWTWARWFAAASVPVLLVGLVLAPAGALTLLWYAVIPLLPATFFLNTALWRGLCPLATLNELGNRVGRQRPLPASTATVLSAGGLVLFHVLVPARRFLFNQHGPVLAVTVVAVGLVAFAMGTAFTLRSGFCNAVCPVLPVELLYGQSPLVRMERGRCTTCSVCAPRGCLDLSHGKAFLQRLGPSRRTAAWLATPYGAFVASLPGFIMGYSRLADGPPTSVLTVYATTLGASLLSCLLVALLVVTFRLESRVVHPAIAALAGALYYWYVGPSVATHLRAASWMAPAIRTLGVSMVMLWLVVALQKSGRPVVR